MNDAQLNVLLIEVGSGSRTAFRALFDEIGPTISRHLAQMGVPAARARPMVADVFARIWAEADQFEMASGMSVLDWSMRLVDIEIRQQSTPTEPVAIDDTLWKVVAQRAYPDSWRNMFHNLGIGSAVFCAVTWAIILLGIRYFR